jgi:hypothetical protein
MQYVKNRQGRMFPRMKLKESDEVNSSKKMERAHTSVGT